MALLFRRLNPFSRLRETKAHPHARTLRNSIWEKLADCWHILTGDGGRAGIFDWITLMIPRVLLALHIWAAHSNILVQFTLYPLLMITNVLVLAARCTFGLVLLIPGFLITVAVHAVSSLVAKPIEENALTLP